MTKKRRRLTLAEREKNAAKRVSDAEKKLANIKSQIADERRRRRTRCKIIAGGLLLREAKDNTRLRAWFHGQLADLGSEDLALFADIYPDLLTSDLVPEPEVADEAAPPADTTEPAASPDLKSPPAAEPSLATAESAPTAVSPADALAAAKRRLQDMLADSLREAEIENTDANIVTLVDALCAQLGVTREEDLTDPGTVESLIALQERSPVDAKAAAGAPSPPAEPEGVGHGDPAGA